MAQQLPCRACDQQFTHENQRKRHRCQVHRDQNVPGFCLLCSDLSFNRFDFYDHFVEAHPAQFQELIQNVARERGQTLEQGEQQIWIVDGAFLPMPTEEDVMKVMSEKNTEKIAEMRRRGVKWDRTPSASGNVPNDPAQSSSASTSATTGNRTMSESRELPNTSNQTLSGLSRPQQSRESSSASTPSSTTLRSVKTEPRDTPESKVHVANQPLPLSSLSTTSSTAATHLQVKAEPRNDPPPPPSQAVPASASTGATRLLVKIEQSNAAPAIQQPTVLLRNLTLGDILREAMPSTSTGARQVRMPEHRDAPSTSMQRAQPPLRHDAAASSTAALPQVKTEPRDAGRSQNHLPNPLAVVPPVAVQQPQAVGPSTGSSHPVLPSVKTEPANVDASQPAEEETFPLSSLSPQRDNVGSSTGSATPTLPSVINEPAATPQMQPTVPLPLVTPTSHVQPSGAATAAIPATPTAVRAETVDSPSSSSQAPTVAKRQKRDLDLSYSSPTSVSKKAKSMMSQLFSVRDGGQGEEEQTTCSRNTRRSNAAAAKAKSDREIKKKQEKTHNDKATASDYMAFGTKVEVVTGALDELRRMGIQDEEALNDAVRQSGIIPEDDATWDPAIAVAFWAPDLLNHLSAYLLVHDRFHVRPYALTRMRQAYDIGGQARDRVMNMIEEMGRKLTEDPNWTTGQEKMIREALGTLGQHAEAAIGSGGVAPGAMMNDADFAEAVAAAAALDEDEAFAREVALTEYNRDLDNEDDEGNQEQQPQQEHQEPPQPEPMVEEMEEDSDSDDPDYRGRP